jgi:multiple sugar transport system permease protein
MESEKAIRVVEACDPFGCRMQSQVDTDALAKSHALAPAGRFNGLHTYFNSTHLASADVARIWHQSAGFVAAARQIFELPLYRALAFTLAYTFIVTPLSIVMGFAIAASANALPQYLRAPITYLTLLPMIVPSVVGALVLFWMIDSRGVIGSFLGYVLNAPNLSLKTSPLFTWITLFSYGVWQSAPYAFIILFAGLQSVPKDTLESAMIDGATRWERLRYVVLPHLRPLFTFLAVISIMDNFRVFEAIIGLSATANATSISLLIFQDLRSGDSPLYGSAAASSMLTIACIALLLLPSLVSNWKTFKLKA